MNGPSNWRNASAWDERKENLSSGFVRYEQDVQPVTLYIGLGRNQRFPDYWELINKESEDSITALHAEPETTTQLDISKSVAMIAGYEQIARVNEPGRTFWLKAQLSFK